MKKIYLLFIVTVSFLFSGDILFGGQKIIKVSGDRQIGVVGYPLTEDFAVKVVSEKDRPLPGIAVSFAIITQPRDGVASEKEIESTLSSALSLTDKDGIARSRLNVGYPLSGEIIAVASTREAWVAPQFLRSIAYSKHWFLMHHNRSSGGLGFFCLDVLFERGASENRGHKLREILITLTGSS